MYAPCTACPAGFPPADPTSPLRPPPRSSPQVRFKNELERNITIKLGYANAKIYKCADPRCPRPACYKAYGSSKEDSPKCDVPGEVRGGRGGLEGRWRGRAACRAL